MQIVQEGKDRIVIRKEDVERYLGKPVFTADEVFESTPGS